MGDAALLRSVWTASWLGLTQRGSGHGAGRQRARAHFRVVEGHTFMGVHPGFRLESDGTVCPRADDVFSVESCVFLVYLPGLEVATYSGRTYREDCQCRWRGQYLFRRERRPSYLGFRRRRRRRASVMALAPLPSSGLRRIPFRNPRACRGIPRIRATTLEVVEKEHTRWTFPIQPRRHQHLRGSSAHGPAAAILEGYAA
ncbi:hypothetical protein C8F01DRAFT_1147189 [Mycena amicta]|nr:hypothetical protein C8F01DRAFT_1147189 [Mycena amicta]